jgi:hypothetical protein
MVEMIVIMKEWPVPEGHSVAHEGTAGKARAQAAIEAWTDAGSGPGTEALMHENRRMEAAESSHAASPDAAVESAHSTTDTHATAHSSAHARRRRRGKSDGSDTEYDSGQQGLQVRP